MVYKPMVSKQQLAVLRFPARTEQLSRVRERLRETLKGLNCDKQFIEYTVLAVDEAVSNVIRHAYGDQDSGDIILEVMRRNDTLVFRLVDFAQPVEQRDIRPRELDDLRPGGLGTYIIQQIMDRVEFVTPPDGVGNILEMSKKLELKL